MNSALKMPPKKNCRTAFRYCEPRNVHAAPERDQDRRRAGEIREQDEEIDRLDRSARASARPRRSRR